jgi:hypothetical protein
MKNNENKTMSDEQIVANQRNGQKSTGPRTPQGKAVQRQLDLSSDDN